MVGPTNLFIDPRTAAARDSRLPSFSLNFLLKRVVSFATRLLVVTLVVFTAAFVTFWRKRSLSFCLLQPSVLAATASLSSSFVAFWKKRSLDR
jgi:hypothetical protein